MHLRAFAKLLYDVECRNSFFLLLETFKKGKLYKYCFSLYLGFRHSPPEPIIAVVSHVRIKTYACAITRTHRHGQFFKGTINVTMETKSLGSLSWLPSASWLVWKAFLSRRLRTLLWTVLSDHLFEVVNNGFQRACSSGGSGCSMQFVLLLSGKTLAFSVGAGRVGKAKCPCR